MPNPMDTLWNFLLSIARNYDASLRSEPAIDLLADMTDGTFEDDSHAEYKAFKQAQREYKDDDCTGYNSHKER